MHHKGCCRGTDTRAGYREGDTDLLSLDTSFPMFRYPEFLSQTELVTLSRDRHIKVILRYACAHELRDYGSIHRAGANKSKPNGVSAPRGGSGSHA